MRRLIPILALFALLFTSVSQAAYHTHRAPDYVNDFESLAANPYVPEMVVVVVEVPQGYLLFFCRSPRRPTPPSRMGYLHRS
jgi:hypothetical protein